MNVKVNKARLVQAIEQKRAVISNNFVVAKAEYDHDSVRYRQQVVEYLQSRLTAVRAATTAEEIANIVSRYRNNLPDAPDMPRENTAPLDAALQRLALVEDEVITLNEKDDYFRYI